MSTAVQLKLSGMRKAESHHKVAVASARLAAALICAAEGSCTIESVYASGIKPEQLGPASGAVFLGGEFERIGFRKAERPSSHARMLSVWRLK